MNSYFTKEKIQDFTSALLDEQSTASHQMKLHTDENEKNKRITKLLSNELFNISKCIDALAKIKEIKNDLENIDQVIDKKKSCRSRS